MKRGFAKEEIGEAIRDAAELIEDLPQHLQGHAFEPVFSAALHSPRRRGGRSGSAANGVRAPSVRTRTVGPKRTVLALLEEGFFDQPKTSEDVVAHVRATRGRVFESREIATGLLRLLRDRSLSRTIDSDGGYLYRRAAGGSP